MSYDARYIANLILDMAEATNTAVTNLEINKITYFAHAIYLGKFGVPLIDAKIEAWDYGPVIREVYSEFKKFGASEIVDRATKLDLSTLKRVAVYEKMNDLDRAFLLPVIEKYMKLGATKLVYLSHEKGGPWDRVYNSSGRSNPGMEISNSLIQDYFSNQTRH
jgi:uncharacterized phage-associated protein